MQHQVDTIVCGVGSSGTITGLTRYFRQTQPNLEFVLADPKGSILDEYIKTGHVSDTSGSWAVEGIGEDFIPAIADLSAVKHAYTIDDIESFGTARELLRAEGVMGGSSTGTLLAAALRYCREQTTPKRVVTFVCDTGTRYLSKLYNDNWMKDQGFLKRPAFGDLRDFIGRYFDEGNVVSVKPDDTLMIAFNRMRATDISQLPVVMDNKIVGIIDESDLILKITRDARLFHSLVQDAMTKKIETLEPQASPEKMHALINRGLIAIIADQNRFYGLITRYDLLNNLRKTLS